MIQVSNSSKITYVYLISDDITHDSVIKFQIICDTISKRPEVECKRPEVEENVLVVRSDNCQDQCKCKFAFHEMKKLASKFGITIVWLYDEAGYGRGLVNAISSFGYKMQLRYEIAINDSWFEYASQMTEFSNQYFEDDIAK